MEIILGKTAGFCFGVANAVSKATKECETDGETYCLGDIANNNQVVDELNAKGLRIIEHIKELPEDKKRLIIRAHGIPKETYEKAREKNIQLIDLTCPKVLKVHEIAESYANKGYYIFLIGKPNHPENIGTISYCGSNSKIVEKIEEVDDAIKSFGQSGKTHLAIIAQTTINVQKFEEIVDNIKKNIEANIEIANTICAATRVRQEETKNIAQQVDYMIIVGGKHSSNSTKLYDIAKKYCKNSIHVETKEELNMEELKTFKKIGIMAGASTPKKSIEEIIKGIEKLQQVE